MPELPEVETVVRGLATLLVGQRIERVEVRCASLRHPVPPGFAARLAGTTVVAVRRRAKYGLVDGDRGTSLLFHLGMSGSFRCLSGAPGRHDHVLFDVAGQCLSFHDPRRFGWLQLVPTKLVLARPPLSELGPEPLSASFSAATLAAACAGRRAPLKALLLDQRIVAGLGNIYAAEALFRARLSPELAGSALGGRAAGRLARAIKGVLREAIAAGGSTLRDHALPTGGEGHFQHAFRVYGRAGEPCRRCGQPIRRIVQSGRSTFFCPHCQSGVQGGA